MRRVMSPRLHRYKELGSALVATLVVLALIAFSVAAMLHNVRQLTRATNDKVAYEESYHVAMAGLQMAKSWIIEPGRARNDLPDADSPKINGITSGSIELSWYVKQHRDDETLLNNMTAAQIADYYSSHTTIIGTDLYGGRKLLWEYTGPGGNGKAIVFQNDATTSEPSGSLFGATDDVRGRVSRIRFTTPFREDGTYNGEPYQKDDLRRVSMIIEAESIVAGAGAEKKRILRQKVLAVPGTTTSAGSISPPLSPGSAIVSGGSVQISGSSHMDVYWGPVQVKGDADLLDIAGVVPDNTAKTLSVNLASNPSKWHHSGFDVSSDSPDVGVDKWLKWQVSGLLFEKQGGNRTEVIPRWDTSLDRFVTTEYSSGQALASNQKYVADLFTQLMYNPYSPEGVTDDSTVFSAAFPHTLGWGIESMRFPAGYMSSQTTTDTGENIYFQSPDADGYRIGEGAFVQKSNYVAQAVDSFMNKDMNYTTWKQFAQSKNLYAKPGSGGFVNADNVPLYVKPEDKTLVPVPAGMNVPRDANGNPYARFTELRQVTMKALVPADGNTFGIPDRILFIDTAEGRPDGTPTDIKLGSDDDFFWKGLFYLQGKLTVGGSGNAPIVRMKNPDQFAADPTGNSTGYLIGRCICDGILYTSGQIDRTGNSSVYGTVAAKGGMGSGGGPVIYYNSRNKMGLFNSPTIVKPSELAALISGPLYEVTAE